MKINLVPGKFYLSKNGLIWCCFHFDSTKEPQARCVRCTDGKVESFSHDGRHDKEENALVSLLPYWGADGSTQQQFKQACKEAETRVRAELREIIGECKGVLDKANDLVEKMEDHEDQRLIEKLGDRGYKKIKCTSTIIDRATRNPTRCALKEDHDGNHDDGAMTWETPTDPTFLALDALQELIDVADAKDEYGDLVIRYDRVGAAANWLLDFANMVRPILNREEP